MIMTEKLPPLLTQIVPPSQVALAVPPPISAQDVSHKVENKAETVEEEPYTIKCICRFADDDGNTIFCETCETWQHIECYYPNNAEEVARPDFAHSCAECTPRVLDAHRAIERQKSRHNNWSVAEPTTDKKSKRPPSKANKKKPKPTDIQVLVPTAGASKQAAAHDQPPAAKKSKNSHKVSHSISSQAAKRSPPLGPGRTSLTHGHPPSPANTPPDLPHDFPLHSYSAEFLSFHAQQDVQTPSANANSFAGIKVPGALSLWLREPAKLRQDTNQEFGDVFQTLPFKTEPLNPSLLRLETKQISALPDPIISWQYLMTLAPVEKDVPLVELNGLIGFQHEYCADKNNRWDELVAPLPYVFFHEMLPLYLDTRKEGSRARYVRRSCKPNTVLDIFLSPETSSVSDYHFWLVSDRHIGPNEPITIAWDFRLPMERRARILQLLGLREDDHASHEQQEIDESEYQHIAVWLYNILSEYGGCACDLGNNCAFARFHRNYLAKAQARSTSKKKSRKPKTHTISPTSTGHATNSRAASEGRFDDGAEGDAASVSGSARSKPPSRDMTPAQTTPAPRQGSFDTLGILTEPTDRDKRKVAMVEDSFRRMEQHQPPRKKKRVSDGAPGTGTATKAKAKASPSGPSNGVHYVDAGTSRSKSGSPSSAVSPGSSNPFRHQNSRQVSAPRASRNASSLPRSHYCDVAVQTDPVEGEWYSESPKPAPVIRKVKSLSKRLLENRHRIRQEEDARRKRESTGSHSNHSDAMLVDSTIAARASESPSAQRPVGTAATLEFEAPAPHAGNADVDIPMTDAPMSPTARRPPQPPVLITEPGLGGPSGSKNKSPELRVQMPPVPPFSGTMSSISAATTPVSATGSLAQSPSTNFANPYSLGAANGLAATHASPIKKKMSLGEYTKRKNPAAARPSVGTSLKTAISHPDDPKSATSVEGPHISESPSTEKMNELHLTSATSESAVNGSC